ncbi:LINE-1 reverse transcriptase homolog [Plakobranchus ocellatus]|uniref:LINE-1 reverse transcriptase homolog n=1 Tax=Plakobranchus ocellatus TaxID=259542 RepID=A0AAV3Y7X4_9GAST|nr:LINE-1 reverse transcriptase homolog [Plakobranchus ocellatus]
MDGPTIFKVEVEAAIKKMKNEKATEPDNIPVEKIEALDNLGIHLTTKLLNAICDSGTIPEDLCKSFFIVLPKTPRATECEIHRTISLMSHVELFRMLEKLDIDGKDLRVIRNLYWDQTASVRIEGERSDLKPTKRGVRQRCVMSPDLFNLYSEMVIRNLDGISGLKINVENLTNLRYADDTV